MSDYAIIMENISKSFGGVHALKHIDLKVKKGEIHAIIGENGAGKSTLMKIISGIYTKDKGTITINGVQAHFTNPMQSQEKGIGIIHQELSLAQDLSVAENIFLDHLGNRYGIVNWKSLNEQAAAILKRFGFHINPKQKLGTLSLAYQQMVEIAKTLSKDINILILDEPTAVLAAPEIDILFNTLRQLKKQGVTIIYISHRLEELFRISDVITVIKDGETVTRLDPKASTEDDIIRHMVGRELSSLYPPKSVPSKDVILEVESLSRRNVLENISFNIAKGEIVGLAGLVGSGRSEIARCLFGIDPIHKGTVNKNGVMIKINNPSSAMKHGIGLIPESRKEQGTILSRSIEENINLSNLRKIRHVLGILNAQKENEISEYFKQHLSIKLGKLTDPISSLSGGNQQKVVLAKWLNTECDMLIFDEPTRGVDVGAKSEIYNIINDFSSKGYGVLVISSELTEVIGICHRTYVMSEGKITGELIGSQMTEESIMRLAIPKRDC